MTQKYETRLVELVEEIAELVQDTTLGGFALNSKETFLFSKIMYLLGYTESLKEGK